MKKFARVLALMLVATMLCVMLVACGATPAADPDDAVKALEDNGYEVSKTEAGKNVIVTGTNMETLDTITITYFEKQEDADAAYEAMEKSYEAMGDLVDEMGYVYGQDGTMVWAGTEDAVSAAS